jgi:L-malate glycosyltransferase
MKILYFTRGQSPHDLRFLKALAGTEHQAAVLCLESSPAYEWPAGIKELRWPNENRYNGLQSALAASRAFKQIVAEFQPDVIHAGPIQRVAFVAALANCGPLLSMSWGSDLLLEADQNLLWQWISRYTLKHSTLLAADCQAVVDKARSFGYTGPVAIFPWGVDLNAFKPGPSGSLRMRLGWEEKQVFLSNRTMEPLYGVEMVARAFALASQKNDDLRLLLYGKGSQEPKIRVILKAAEDAGKVYYGGFASLAELPEVYHSADVYVSASHSDGSSVSLMEALACGLPALISDIPSNREWIEPGKQGWLFADGNVLYLAERMLASAVEPNRQQLGKNARQLAQDRADWQKNFAILLGAYQQARDLYQQRKK